jgi:hypothetical protein
MAWDWTIKITDIIMIFAVAAGPVIAVQITEYLRHKKDARGRKVHIFRVLMSTRSAQLAPAHIEALNLIELEFPNTPRSSKRVVDAARLYVAHLSDHNYPKEAWPTRKDELLVDLLYEMSTALGYNFDKVQIKSGSYYPSGYQDTQDDNLLIRKLWLSVLKGENKLPITIQQSPFPIPDKTQDDKPVQQDGCSKSA